MEPLGDPKRQIRLLRLVPGSVDDNISCEMTVHGFDESTPEYLAISYTWGDTAYPRGIFINDGLRMVRQNCHYALWQARYHYPGAYVWIDAVCIDQENLEEKSRQVGIMSKIFAQAIEVLACVGPANDDSEFLWTFSQEFTYQALRPIHQQAFTSIEMSGYSRASISCEELWNHWETSNSAGTLQRFLKACNEFRNRPYWERLWIFQEVALARVKSVLCGSLCLPWTATRNLDLLAKLKKAQALLNFSYSTFGLVSSWYPYRFMEERSLFIFRRLKCDDVRDRIFGTQVFLRFHHRKLHIEPDYSRGALELAMTIMRHNVPWTYTSSLLCLLEINMNCPEFRALIHWRFHQDVSMNSEVPSRYHMRFNASQLRRDGKGRLTCSLASIYPGGKDLTMLDFVTSVSNDKTLDGMLSGCVRVYAGEEVAFLLGNEAREGDYLAEVESDAGLYFVLRLRAGKMFDIVSQGFSLRSHTICYDRRGSCDCANQGIAHDTLLDACFATSLSVEDFVVFVGQDLLGCDEECKLQHDPTARLRRLITPVSSCPRPIAIMEYDGWEYNSIRAKAAHHAGLAMRPRYEL